MSVEQFTTPLGFVNYPETEFWIVSEVAQWSRNLCVWDCGIVVTRRHRKSALLQKLVIRNRPDDESFRFWLEGSGYDRNLRKPKAIQASLDYLHENPVRRGLCKSAVQWKWSSARWYLSNPPRQQDPDLPCFHGRPGGALDG